MKKFTLDASAVAAAFFNEPHGEAVARLVVSGQALHAPDLLRAEVGNVVWKRHRRGEINDEEAIELVDDLLRLPLIVTASADLVGDAVRLAILFKRTVYDSIYLALAVRSGARLISGDKRLVRSLAGTTMKRHVMHVGELA